MLLSVYDLTSLQEYISVLQDRLRLCKAELAGAAGAEDLMKFFFTKETDVSYVEDLKQRLTYVLSSPCGVQVY